MYDSPIDLYISDIHNQIVAQQDEQIYKAVVRFFPDVKREELLKALLYDRDQYEKGYADGRRDAKNELVRCGECERRSKSADLTDTIYCPWLKLQMRKEDFCSYGEREDGDGNG